MGIIAMELLTNVSSREELRGESEAVDAALGRLTYPWEREVGEFADEKIEVLTGLPPEAVRSLIQGCLKRHPQQRLTAAEALELLL